MSEIGEGAIHNESAITARDVLERQWRALDINYVAALLDTAPQDARKQLEGTGLAPLSRDESQTMLENLIEANKRLRVSESLIEGMDRPSMLTDNTDPTELLDLI
jgi:hypothetical protein